MPRKPLFNAPMTGAERQRRYMERRDARLREEGRGDRAVSEPTPEADLYEMVNLAPAETGLPMTIFASPRGHARHDVRIKVNGVHGPRMTLEQEASVAVRPAPRVVAGHLDAADRQAVFAWITLNEAALVEYWEFRIYTGEFLRRLQRLP